MRPSLLVVTTSLLAALAVPASAQERLTLADALSQALARNPVVRSTDAAVGEATERIAQARSGYLPRLDLVESAQRGNQPVFAFSSLLSARQFSPSDFAISTLNHPDAITNYHTGIAIEQPVFDGFRTRSAMRSAELGRSLAQADRLEAREELALGVTRAYGQVLLAQAMGRAAESAVRAAEEDVKRAANRRDNGLATEADVLALEVHLAQMRERRIRSASEETIARAELNQAMGEPLDRQYVLDDTAPVARALPPINELEQQALAARTEMKAAQLQQALAAETQRGARSAFLPQVSVQGFFELNGNGEAFANHASAWMFGAQARWTLFSGLADVARLREAGLASARAGADRDRTETAVRVDVRSAAARVASAVARVQVGQAAVSQARESQRIIRDRYDAGMVSVTDILRAANAVLDAESQRIGSMVDLLVSNAMLDRALGRSPDEPTPGSTPADPGTPRDLPHGGTQKQQ